MTDTRDPVAANDIFSEHLVAMAQHGDRAAFGAVFGYFAPRVKAYLMRLGAPSAVAEELAQEAMLTVWRKAGYYDPRKSQASTWIFTIARNLRIDASRREMKPPDIGDEPILEPACVPDGEQVVMSGERDERLRKALEQLPPEQSEVVMLSFFADKPHVDICADLGIPLGTVKSRLRLAMSRLRAALGDVL